MVSFVYKMAYVKIPITSNIIMYYFVQGIKVILYCTND